MQAIDIGTLIVHSPETLGDCPRIAGTRISVQRIVSWYKTGLNAEEIAERMGNITLAQVYAGLTYYHANGEEIEALLADEKANYELGMPTTVELSPTYLEVLDFLVTRPTSEQLLTFKVSEQSQERLQALLQKNRDASLNPSETAELNMYEQLDSLMTLLKVRAFAATQNISSNSHPA
jgi:uncharacterized protein (DUF433 family)